MWSYYTDLHQVFATPMDFNMPGLTVPRQFPEFPQVHVHYISDAIQPSHSLMPSSPSALNLSQHQGLSQWVDCIRWPKYWSFSFSISPSSVNIQSCSPLRLTGFISLLSKGLSGVSSSTAVWRHQFFGTLPNLTVVQFNMHPWRHIQGSRPIASLH